MYLEYYIMGSNCRINLMSEVWIVETGFYIIFEFNIKNIYISLYLCVCMCVCVCIYIYIYIYIWAFLVAQW